MADFYCILCGPRCSGDITQVLQCSCGLFLAAFPEGTRLDDVMVELMRGRGFVPSPPPEAPKPQPSVMLKRLSEVVPQVVVLPPEPEPEPEPEEPSPSQYKQAFDFAQSYDGDFSFMVDMRRLTRNGKPLTPGQAAAVLNCMHSVKEKERPKKKPKKPKSRPTSPAYGSPYYTEQRLADMDRRRRARR